MNKDKLLTLFMGKCWHGWPKCCGYTMTIDAPDTWFSKAKEATDE